MQTDNHVDTCKKSAMVRSSAHIWTKWFPLRQRLYRSEMSNLIQNHNINLRTCIMFMNAFVRSRLTYSCQNWTLNQVQYDRIDVCYRRYLRKMVRGGFKRNDKCENEFSMKINNNILHLLCGTSDVSQFIKEQKCNYAGHIVRTSFDRASKK